MCLLESVLENKKPTLSLRNLGSLPESQGIRCSIEPYTDLLKNAFDYIYTRHKKCTISDLCIFLYRILSNNDPGVTIFWEKISLKILSKFLRKKEGSFIELESIFAYNLSMYSP
jgi:hypothetical protein